MAEDKNEHEKIYKRGVMRVLNYLTNKNLGSAANKEMLKILGEWIKEDILEEATTYHSPPNRCPPGQCGTPPDCFDCFFVKKTD